MKLSKRMRRQIADVRLAPVSVTEMWATEVSQLEAEVEALRGACKEAMEEIVYCHNDMLTEEERAHPRGSGWARVYDKLDALLKGGYAPMSLSEVKEKYLPNKNVEELRRKPDVSFLTEDKA